MAKLLFREGGFRILSDDVGRLQVKEMNQLIKTAGTTCYQTRETSKKTPEEFIQMLQKRGHHAMLEHSWYTFLIGNTSPKVVSNLFQANSLFCITLRDNGFLVSGNSRIFNEAYLKKRDIVTGMLLSILNKENPVLFPLPKEGFEITSLLKITRNPKLQTKDEVLTHRAMTVEFNNHSRGFTHETVRSRSGDEKVTSYAQESTRYVDYSKGEVDLEKFQMKFILPYNDVFDFNQKISFSVDGREYSLTPQEFTDLMEGWYRALRKSGLRPEEARQWLPIGIKSQIVQTYNLREWRHWFKIRSGAAAHPEIRFSALNLLRETQRRIPGVFDDFEFKVKEDGSEYAVYIGEDYSLV